MQQLADGSHARGRTMRRAAPAPTPRHGLRSAGVEDGTLELAAAQRKILTELRRQYRRLRMRRAADRGVIRWGHTVRLYGEFRAQYEEGKWPTKPDMLRRWGYGTSPLLRLRLPYRAPEGTTVHIPYVGRSTGGPLGTCKSSSVPLGPEKPSVCSPSRRGASPCPTHQKI